MRRSPCSVTSMPAPRPSPGPPASDRPLPQGERWEERAIHLSPWGRGRSDAGGPGEGGGARGAIALSVLLLWPGATLAADAAGNVLPNPSFEEVTGDDVVGWTPRVRSRPEDVRLSVDSSGRSGQRSVCIVSEKGGSAAWTATVPVLPRTLYRVFAWIRTDGVQGGPGAAVKVRNAANAETKAVSGTREWTRVMAVFKTGNSTNLEVACCFGERHPSAGRAWYDDVVIEKADRRPASVAKAERMVAACPRIAFIRRARYGLRGMQSVTFSQRTDSGSAICVYDPNRSSEGAATVFETKDGFIFDMNPCHEGKKLVFAYKETANDPFHIWEIGVDGKGLRQLTRGSYHDVSPVYYPDGRIVFTSSRVESYSLCQNYLACALHVMRGDGADMRRIDWTTLCTTTPCVLSDGSILCTRWEYQDKNIFGWGGLWTVNPNGRQLKLYHGNTFRVPNIVCGAREIPGTGRVIVTWTGHHREPIGDLAIIDRGKGLETPESMWKITHVTPVQKDLASGEGWTKTGVGPFGADSGYGYAFTDPYPFTSEYSLVSYGGDRPRERDLYVLEHATGETALVHDDDGQCFCPVPLVPRPRPATIPGDCPQEAGMGTFLVQDVYQGLLEQGVKRGTVKRLRIMSQSPKKYNTEGFRFSDHYPVIGQGSYYVKRNHGTVPVDGNGSAYFRAPANTELYFIALDENGKEVQRMGSVVQITGGEAASCVGCHENRLAPPPVEGEGMARTARPPDDITPPPWGAGPVDYVRQVQPILDRYCVKCHSGPEAGRGIDLTGDKTRFYNMSYESLTYGGYVNYYYINRGPNGVFPALGTGSWVSKLTRHLESNHGERKVVVDDQSRRCIYAWIDANVPYYGLWDMSRPHTVGGRDAYARTLPGKGTVFAPQGGGRQLIEVLPWVAKYNEFAGRSGGRVRKIYLGGGNRFRDRGLINLTRPEWSPVLLELLPRAAGGRADAGKAYFTNREDPGYRELLAILKEAKAGLDELPRMDMPGGKAIAQERNFGRTF